MKLVLRFGILLFLSVNYVHSQHNTPDSVIVKYKLNYSPPKKKYKFSKIKYQEKIRTQNIIDTNCAYVINLIEAYDMGGKTYIDTSFGFMRFYANGVVFRSSGFKSFPPDEELSKTNYGRWCMYTIKKDKIIIEEHVNDSPLLPRFHYLFARKENENLHFYKYKIGRLITNAQPRINWVYKKRPMKFTDYTINWQ